MFLPLDYWRDSDTMIPLQTGDHTKDSMWLMDWKHLEQYNIYRTFNRGPNPLILFESLPKLFDSFVKSL